MVARSVDPVGMFQSLIGISWDLNKSVTMNGLYLYKFQSLIGISWDLNPGDRIKNLEDKFQSLIGISWDLNGTIKRYRRSQQSFNP